KSALRTVTGPRRATPSVEYATRTSVSPSSVSRSSTRVANDFPSAACFNVICSMTFADPNAVLTMRARSARCGPDRDHNVFAWMTIVTIWPGQFLGGPGHPTDSERAGRGAHRRELRDELLRFGVRRDD